jgi:hypothetical protein
MNGIKGDSLLSRVIRAGLVGLGGLGVVAGSAIGCLDRPVSGQTPNTTNIFVDVITQSTIDKIDLLFMIDNSLSMADKQEILKLAVPQLVDRLVNPVCVDKDGNKSAPPCSGDLKPEFKPVVDIHIGVISSSIGGHGGDQCSESSSTFNQTQVDNGHLIPSVRSNLNLPSYQNLGFLWWDAGTPPKGNPPGETNPANLKSQFQQHVVAAGEIGCGYEASLEAWYRFLVDPHPPAKVVVQDNNAVIQGVDQVVKQQRLDFLRPDSLVAIIMLSDENDCSIIDGGFNWIAAQTTNSNNQPYHLPRATAVCQNNPDDPCCRSCSSSEPNGPPAGCQDLGSDPECQKGVWDDVGDHPNLRCWQQKRRFGLEFLYPTARYVQALTQQNIYPCWNADGPYQCCYDEAENRVPCNGQKFEPEPNPLFTNQSGGAGVGRSPDLIYFGGIVGVPWQDIATDDTLNDPNALRYKKAAQINWDWLTPTCKKRINDDPAQPCLKWDLNDQPDDPLMIESTVPRTGTNPATNQALVDPAGGEMANPINGHEWNTSESDLQFACIFDLEPDKDCNTTTSAGCDCDNAQLGTGSYTENNPLCQNGASYSKLQRYAKAYPGQRQLEVLRDFGVNSIVASICPKITKGDPLADGFGYNPAVNAIIERLKEVLTVQCINRPVAIPKVKQPDGTCAPDPNALPQCAVVEVQPSGGAGCPPCDTLPNRTEVTATAQDKLLIEPILTRLAKLGKCGNLSATKVPCTAPPSPNPTFCMCKLGFADNKASCENDDPAQGTGWCYVDPEQGIGNPKLVEGCTPPRQLRFVGTNTPASGATVVMACLGATVTEGDSGPAECQ